MKRRTLCHVCTRGWPVFGRSDRAGRLLVLLAAMTTACQREVPVVELAQSVQALKSEGLRYQRSLAFESTGRVALSSSSLAVVDNSRLVVFDLDAGVTERWATDLRLPDGGDVSLASLSIANERVIGITGGVAGSWSIGTSDAGATPIGPATALAASGDWLMRSDGSAVTWHEWTGLTWVSRGSVPCANCQLGLSDGVASTLLNTQLRLFRRDGGTWSTWETLTVPRSTSSLTVSLAPSGSWLVTTSQRLAFGPPTPSELKVYEVIDGGFQLSHSVSQSALFQEFAGAVLLDQPDGGRVIVTLVRPLSASDGGIECFSNVGGWHVEERLPLKPGLSAIAGAAPWVAFSNSSVGGSADLYQWGARRLDGAPCEGDTACGSGFCRDGVCCASACGAPCFGCSRVARGGGATDGVCEPVLPDVDVRDDCRPAVDYPSSCGADGRCDGAGACRSQAVDGTRCGPARCEADTVVVATCVQGACRGSASQTTCAPYRCTGDACTARCVSSEDCAGTARCSSNQECVSQPVCENNAVVSLTGERFDCAPYVCLSEGRCAEQCRSRADCVRPAVCTREGRCLAPPTVPDDQGWGCRTAGGLLGWVVVAWWVLTKR